MRAAAGGLNRSTSHTWPPLSDSVTNSHSRLHAEAGQAACGAETAGWMSRGLGIGRVEVVVRPQAPHPYAAVVAGSEDVAVVGGDRVDGRVVCLHLTHQVARLGAPELDVASAAAANDDRMGGQEGQPANPVLVRIV